MKIKPKGSRMVRKYDDNYIDLGAINAVTSIEDTYYTQGNGRYVFLVVLNGFSIEFKNNSIKKIEALRDRLVNDWIEYIKNQKQGGFYGKSN